MNRPQRTAITLVMVGNEIGVVTVGAETSRDWFFVVLTTVGA